MKRAVTAAALILIGAAWMLSACKGKEGPAGPAGASYQPPGPPCATAYNLGYDIGPTGNPTLLPADTLLAQAVTYAGAVTAFKMSVYVAGSPVTGQVRMGIYNDDGANNPGTLMVQTDPLTLAPASWNMVNLPYNTYLPAGNYWIAFHFTNPTNVSMFGTFGTQRLAAGVPPGIFPAQFPVAGSSGSTWIGFGLYVCE